MTDWYIMTNKDKVVFAETAPQLSILTDTALGFLYFFLKIFLGGFSAFN